WCCAGRPSGVGRKSATTAGPRPSGGRTRREPCEPPRRVGGAAPQSETPRAARRRDRLAYGPILGAARPAAPALRPRRTRRRAVSIEPPFAAFRVEWTAAQPFFVADVHNSQIRGIALDRGEGG